MSNTGIIYGVNGPVIYLKGDSGFKISEMVYVGPEHLVGEIIGLKKGMTTVQVFEETTGLKPGDISYRNRRCHFCTSWDLESSTIFLMVSSVLWKRLPKPPANIFPEVSASIPLTQKRNGTHTSQ